MRSGMGRLLVIDPSQKWEAFLRTSFGEGHDIDYHSSGGAWLTSLTCGYDIVLMCFQNRGNKDLEMLKQIREQVPHTPVVVLGQHFETDSIVQAVKEGAFDVVPLPASEEKMRLVLTRALEHRQIRDEIDYLRHDQGFVYDFDKIVAESAVMRSVLHTLKKFSMTDATILMTGETGTGKSFLSGSVHFNSRRKNKSFITINCANIPETLLESELFGHEKGAFTGADKMRVGRLEQGNGGTVFLDEIGEMVPSLQSKMLRVLEEKSFERLGGNRTIVFDVRIIAATNRDLETLVAEGTFREDLYYRINVLRIHLPPLRERRKCIVPLAKYILDKVSRDLKKKIFGFEPSVLESFLQYAWPGNLRQLKNVIERAAILEESDAISGENIVLSEKSYGTVVAAGDRSLLSDYSRSISLEHQEREMILLALRENDWVQKEAAKRLGVSPRALNYKIKKFGITYKGWRKHR